eukprot:360578-Chlamydomonas_euryale.AAC.23
MQLDPTGGDIPRDFLESRLPSQLRTKLFGGRNSRWPRSGTFWACMVAEKWPTRRGTKIKAYCAVLLAERVILHSL